MPTRQSSPKASSIAGRVLADIRKDDRERRRYAIRNPSPAGRFLTTAELKTLCASVLAQDETKGQRHVTATVRIDGRAAVREIRRHVAKETKRLRKAKAAR